MIKLNNDELKVEHFPDGTLHIKPNLKLAFDENNVITWLYENEEEFSVLIHLAHYLQEMNLFYELVLPYIPNARMDRRKSQEDVFTLRSFANILNLLGFSKVFVYDPHSPVSEALINNLEKIRMDKIIEPFIASIKLFSQTEDIVVYFPDNGAAKKYEDLFKGYKTCYGIKHRDWETGKIKGLEVITNDIDLKDKTILMFDDIISYGGSMYYGALKLKGLGAKTIFAYASHVENSILDKNKGKLIKLLENGTVERVFTTNSIYTGSHEKISVNEFF